MTTAYEKLLGHLGEIDNIRKTLSIMEWDQQVNMPPGGAMARGRQMATLARMAHTQFTAEKTAELLQAAAQERDGDAPDSDSARMIAVVRKDYDDATKLPADHVAEFTEVTTQAHETWVKARQDKDFAQFAPMLGRIVTLVCKTASYRGYDENPYDALLDDYERGLTTAEVTRIFDGHRDQLVQLIAAIAEVDDRVSDKAVHQPFALAQQEVFALDVVKQLGFDFTRGRQDVAVHPFMIQFSRDDVRLTTRFEDDFFNPALFGMMHEAGHGMYEQGVAAHLDGTMLAEGTSLSVHESQSRMWENIVGRSKHFWHWALPLAQKQFPQLSGVDLDTFYKAVNRVQRSFIRVEADEATYNLHIMVRFELENDLINGVLAVKDLPDAWNSRFESYFGMVPPDDAQGVLQDVHWAGGSIGYFPTYALGNLLSVQFYNAALKAHPNLPDEFAQGKFDTLLGWLRQNIHQHGRKFTGEELTQRVTGEAMQSASYIAYLEEKYTEIYSL